MSVLSDKKVAIEGCCHGELDNIYKALSQCGLIDLLICCGDFQVKNFCPPSWHLTLQAARNEEDLNTMSCPDKYRRMNTFYKYYTGELVVALVATIF
jgi:lariat debranching enzyme